MKGTGINRRVDRLGRVVIPSEIRNGLNIKENDLIEFGVDVENDLILLKKVDESRKMHDNALQFLAEAKEKNLFESWPTKYRVKALQILDDK